MVPFATGFVPGVLGQTEWPVVTPASIQTPKCRVGAHKCFTHGLLAGWGCAAVDVGGQEGRDPGGRSTGVAVMLGFPRDGTAASLPGGTGSASPLPRHRILCPRCG